MRALIVASPFRRGAAYGNRTRLLGLGSRCTTDVLMPQIWCKGIENFADMQILNRKSVKIFPRARVRGYV